MEQKLKKLFDFQRLEKNPRLERLIKEAEGDATALSDDELSLVSAAGETGEIQVGGIAGRNDAGTIQNCNNTGGITGDFTGNYADKQ